MAITINGTANTVAGLAVGGLPDGTVDADTLASNSVTNVKVADDAIDSAELADGGIDSVHLAAGVGGISDVDQWYLKSSVTSDGTLTDLGRSSDKFSGSAAQIGTGMSVSSGIFTFPSTGKWLVIAHAYLTITPGDQIALETHVTTDNSSYAMNCSAVDGQNASSGGTRSGSSTSFAFIDVTDTSNVKVKFEGASIASPGEVRGGDTAGNGMFSHFTFIRVGAT